MIVDRTQAPKIKTVSHIDLHTPQSKSDQHVFFWAQDDQMEAVKVDLVFRAGSRYQNKKLVAKLTADLLLSGTQEQSASEIAAAIDLLGGFSRVEPSKDYLSVQFYGMAEHIHKIVTLGLEAIQKAIFPEHEWKEQLNISKSAFKQASEKVSVLSRRAFYKKMYAGTDYDSIASVEDFDRVVLEDVVQFHQNVIAKKAPAIFVSGAYCKDLESKLNDYLEHFSNSFTQPEIHNNEPKPTPFEVIQVEKEGAIQNALRMGRKLWGYNHPDRIPFSVVNTILGGYFGSRLMMNIREDKGYTYGIGSYYLSHEDFGVWGIATEIGSDYTKPTFDEIEREVNRLRDEVVGDEELQRVKNYMVGQLLTNTDGTFAVMEQFKSLWLRHVSLDSLQDWLHIVQSISSTEIQKLAQQYLNMEHFTVVNAGQPTTFR